APADDPEIVVSVFLYYGGEGSEWAAPIACNIMAAYLKVGQYAPVVEVAEGETAPPRTTTCPSLSFIPEIPQGFLEWAKEHGTVLPQTPGSYFDLWELRD